MSESYEGIVKLIDMVEDHQSLYLIMEYVGPQSPNQGPTPNLLKWLIERERTQAEVREITRSLISTAHTIHSLGIVHRDIKMENIIVHQRFSKG